MLLIRRRAAQPVAAALICAALAGCAAAPLGTGLPKQWRASPNFDERRPNLVILHHTTDDEAEQGLRTLTDPLQKVSAHYLVGRDGTVLKRYAPNDAPESLRKDIEAALAAKA